MTRSSAYGRACPSRMTVWAIACLAASAASPAHSQESPSGASRTRFEITPFAGFSAGGSFDEEATGADVDVRSDLAWGIAFDVPANAATQFGLFYSRQPTSVSADSPLTGSDFDVEYLHLSGTTTPEETEHLHLRPYLVGGLGVTRFSLDAEGTEHETHFSISIAGGFRVPLRHRLELRAEARGYLTFFDSSSSMFCASQAGCVLRGSGSTFTQIEVLVGGTFAF